MMQVSVKYCAVNIIIVDARQMRILIRRLKNWNYETIRSCQHGENQEDKYEQRGLNMRSR